MQAIKNFILNNLSSIILFFAVLLLGVVVIKILLSVIASVLRRSHKLPSVAVGFIVSVLRIVLLLVYIIALLTLLGVPTTSLVAILTAASLAFSLAVQSVLSNFAGGLVIVSTHPFKEGDFVDIGGTSGVVKEINIVNTQLLSTDNKVITIPNGTVSTANIINYNTSPTRRVDLTFSVAYGSSLDKVKSVIAEVVGKQEGILSDKDVTIRLMTQGASALEFVTRVWVNAQDYWKVYFDLNEKVLDAFGENGIEVPFNQLDVHIKN